MIDHLICNKNVELPFIFGSCWRGEAKQLVSVCFQSRVGIKLISSIPQYHVPRWAVACKYRLTVSLSWPHQPRRCLSTRQPFWTPPFYGRPSAALWRGLQVCSQKQKLFLVAWTLCTRPSVAVFVELRELQWNKDTTGCVTLLDMVGCE